MQESPAWMEFFNAFEVQGVSCLTNNGMPTTFSLSNNLKESLRRKYLRLVSGKGLNVITPSKEQVFVNTDKVYFFPETTTKGEIYQILLDVSEADVVCTDCKICNLESIPLSSAQERRELQSADWFNKGFVSTHSYVKITGDNPIIEAIQPTGVDFASYKDVLNSVQNTVVPLRSSGISARVVASSALSRKSTFSIQRQLFSRNTRTLQSARIDLFKHSDNVIEYLKIAGSPEYSFVDDKKILGYDKGLIVIENYDFNLSSEVPQDLLGYFVDDPNKTLHKVYGVDSDNTLVPMYFNKLDHEPHSVGKLDVCYKNISVFGGFGATVLLPKDKVREVGQLLTPMITLRSKDDFHVRAIDYL